MATAFLTQGKILIEIRTFKLNNGFEDPGPHQKTSESETQIPKSSKINY
jgi:hypothetical protein